MKDQALEVRGEVGKREFGLCVGNADRADEKAIAFLLMSEDMLYAGADRGLRGVCARHVPRHRLALGLAAMDAAFEHVGREQCLVVAAAMGAVDLDIAGRVAHIDYAMQLATIAFGSRGHGRLRMNPKRRSMLMYDSQSDNDVAICGSGVP